MLGSSGVHPQEQPMVVERVVGGHGVEDGGVRGADVNDETGEAGGHADSLGHVEGLLGVVTVAAGARIDAGGAGAVSGEQGDGPL